MPAKTPNKKLIKDAVQAALHACAESRPNNEVSNCTFVGVQFDAKAVDAIQSIASALSKNAEGQRVTAEALRDLAQVLRASNVTVETMLRIQG